MKRSALFARAIASALLFVCPHLPGAEDPSPKGKVAITMKADRIQPAENPVIIEMTVENVGDENVSWWCGGPDSYPGDKYFRAETRLGLDRSWRSTPCSNGQYNLGSGTIVHLKPGESIVVPLVVAVDIPAPKRMPLLNDDVGAVLVRVRPVEWMMEKVEEAYVEISAGRQVLDERRFHLISSVSEHGSSFWRHVATKHADDVVIDAMVKLAGNECRPLASNAARVLAGQQTLQEAVGTDLAWAVRRWGADGKVSQDLCIAALKSHSREAREQVLDLLKKIREEQALSGLTEALMTSPGDISWLKRARDAVEFLQQEPGLSETNKRQAKRVVDWLDSRIKYPDSSG
jgi:hypothetical protein